MKISEFSTDEALDVLVELTPCIEEIFNDKELLAELKQKINLSKGATKAEMVAVVASKMTKIAPILLTKKRDAVLSIIAIVNRMTLEEVRHENFIKLMIQLKEIFNDKELIDFFKSSEAMKGSE